MFNIYYNPEAKRLRPGPFGIRRVDNEDLQTQDHVASVRHPADLTARPPEQSVPSSSVGGRSFGYWILDSMNRRSHER